MQKAKYSDYWANKSEEFVHKLAHLKSMTVWAKIIYNGKISRVSAHQSSTMQCKEGTF